MVKANVLKISAIVVGCACIMLVLTASLPGEVGSCEAESGVEANLVQYCMDRCAKKAEKEGVGKCDIFDGAYTEQEIYEQCYIAKRCDDPPLCTPRCVEASQALCPEGTYWQPFISTTEAQDCLEALERQSCSELGQVPVECSDTQVCDPK